MKYKKSSLVGIVILLLLSGLLGFMVSLYRHHEVISTPSSPGVETIQTVHYPASFVRQVRGDPQAGHKIFKEFCAACHDKQPVIAIPAPPIGDAKAWQSRRRLGMPALLKMTINGRGAMPARGGCFECSDKQLQATIQYILNQSK